MKSVKKPLNKPRIKPTFRQKRAAKVFADQLKSTDSVGAVTQKALLEQVGYSKDVAENPQTVTRSPGFQAELAKYGLTEELVTSALVTDIELKPQRRFLELSLAAEILGMKSRAFNAHAKEQQNMAIQNAVIVIHTPKE